MSSKENCSINKKIIGIDTGIKYYGFAEARLYSKPLPLCVREAVNGVIMQHVLYPIISEAQIVIIGEPQYQPLQMMARGMISQIISRMPLVEVHMFDESYSSYLVPRQKNDHAAAAALIIEWWQYKTYGLVH